jgi:hypothetical protein
MEINKARGNDAPFGVDCLGGLFVDVTDGDDAPVTNTNVGAQSNAYPWLPDARWFFEAVGGGSMLTPFDMASYCQLINVAGTNPPAADMRGTTVIGAQREWGPLEYDPSLDVEGGAGGGPVRILPIRGGIG